MMRTNAGVTPVFISFPFRTPHRGVSIQLSCVTRCHESPGHAQLYVDEMGDGKLVAILSE